MQVRWNVHFLLLFATCMAKEANPLKGKRLLVMPIDLPLMLMVTRNATGAVVDAHGSGVDIMHWLSRYLGFEYAMATDFVKNYDNSSAGRGAKSYLLDGEVDMILTAIVLTPERYNQVDFPFPWLTGSYNLMIPFPEVSINMSATWEPFTLDVWILILVSVFGLSFCLKLASSYVQRRGFAFEDYFNTFKSASDYVVTVLFAQGGVCYPTSFKIRSIAAAWCLAAFVITSSYSSVLISYVSSSNFEPLVRSIYDIPKTPGVKIVVDEKMSMDIILSDAKTGILKELGDMLRRDPTLRCPTADGCLKRVKSGSYVYIQSGIVQLFYVGEDLKKNGKCSFTMTRNRFLVFYASYALPKNSPYTKWFTEGIIRLQETGLPNLWESWYAQDAKRCLNYMRQQVEKPRLSMKHLSSAFTLLGIGYSLSLVVFIVERMKRI